jgi:hypothetical protein
MTKEIKKEKNIIRADCNYLESSLEEREETYNSQFLLGGDGEQCLSEPAPEDCARDYARPRASAT